MPNHVSLRARKAEIFRDLLVTVVFGLAIVGRGGGEIINPVHIAQ